MSEHTFLLPDLGEGLTEAEIVDWRVQVGETVSVDQVIVEVETAKASVELPVPFAGTVVELHAQAGSTVAVGSPLITVRTADVRADADPQPGGDGADEPDGSGPVLVGYGTREHEKHRTRPAPQETTTVPAVISPVVRKLARDNNIDLSRIPGSGAHGVITRADVEQALAARAPAGPEVQRIPMTAARRTGAEKLSRSRQEIPDATTWVDVDATGLLAARESIRAAAAGDVSLLALLARLALAALRQFPELNSSVDSARSEIVRFRHVNLGVAVDTPRGLVVPVIEQADALDLIELSEALAQATTAARDGSLPPSRLTGGTFTLNNYGVFGVDGATPIINYPEAAILGVGRIIDRPWVHGGALSVRKTTQLSLSFDHRVCDGATAGGFLRLFADFVENPVTAMARL
ncbi:dihydrolipoamide acetyltransferase family protein [Mycobacterium botniense]|uniref:Dihydrolipoamide acetyltransferase component of pyruvate dehydrogenase complex n=1 Tax=Mycobacterium botniense TaxID=84962 RepID=A0A7I9XT62_9MYCO|nr:dihydrolipoamide acetyltransferase family protein [Mycobacterium botniense]GFG73183.1 dihydrolipoamide acetyltransferase component of pyruvate dehydrogenase complex [Mycobacterium botniense]